MDGFRPGLDNQIMSTFVCPTSGSHFEDKTRTAFCITYEEDSLGKRRSKERGIVAQVEGLHVLSKGVLSLTRVNRKVYKGTNMGTLIGPVVVDSYTDKGVWRLPTEKKKLVYGSSGKVLVGGGLANCPAKPKFEDDREPVTWHGSPLPLCIELIHSFQACMVYNATECDGSMAKAAILCKVPYVGAVHTADHFAMLTAHLTRWIWDQYADQSSPLYQAGLLNPENLYDVQIDLQLV